MGQSHSEKGASHLASPLPHSSQATLEQNSSPESPESSGSPQPSTPLPLSKEIHPVPYQADNSNEDEMSSILLPKSSRMVKNHPPDNLLSEIDRGITTRSQVRNLCAFYAFVAEFEP